MCLGTHSAQADNFYSAMAQVTQWVVVYYGLVEHVRSTEDEALNAAVLDGIVVACVWIIPFLGVLVACIEVCLPFCFVFGC